MVVGCRGNRALLCSLNRAHSDYSARRYGNRVTPFPLVFAGLFVGGVGG
jgi:hypothetical protein